jgi:transposase
MILPPGDWLAVRGMPLARARVLTCLALSGSGAMARIVDHLPVAELEARYRAARDVTEARHYQAIWLLAQGRSFLEVGEVMAFAPRWLEELAARYNTHGPAALGDQRRRNGRAASLLTKEVLAALAERLWTPPEDGGLWSGPKVAAWMARQLGLERVHPQRGWEALKRLDWSLQAPRPRHPRAATPEQQAAFKGGSMPLSLRPRWRIPTGRSRSGRRTSTALA